MRRFLVLVAALAASLAAVAFAGARRRPVRDPDRGTQWVDFADGSVPFWYRFAKPGVIAAASNLLFPPQLRAGGAHTVYFDLYLNNRVGSPSKRVDPAKIEDQANRIFYRAVASSGCAFPWIALNELFGANDDDALDARQRAVPRERARVRAHARRTRRASRSCSCPTAPVREPTRRSSGGGRSPQYAYIIREVYFAAPQINKLGPVLGSRRMRGAFRQRHHRLRGHGHPALADRALPRLPGRAAAPAAAKGSSGIALVPQHQAAGARGPPGRVGAEDPLDLVVGLGSLGLDEGRPRQGDRRLRLPLDAQPGAVRRPGDGRAEVRRRPHRGPDHVASRAVSSARSQAIRSAAGEIGALTRLTGDRQAAFTALSARVAASLKVPVREREIVAAERSVIRHRFGGSRGAYRAALARAART